MTDETYVTNEAWLRPAGRPDLIDDVADQFERPAAGAAGFWSGEAVRWPQPSRGWRSDEAPHPRPIEPVH
jgi:hypothetical protein